MTEELLDYQEPEKVKKTSRQVAGRAIIYLLVMLTGGGCFFFFFVGSFGQPGLNFFYAISFGKYFIYHAFGFMLIVEMVKLIWRKLRKIERHLKHPLWFELVENTFVCWIFYIVIIITSVFFK